MLKLSHKRETSLVGNNSCRRLNPGKFANGVFHADRGFQKQEKCLKMNRKPRDLYKYTDAVGTMVSACDGWLTHPPGKWEGSIREEIKIQVWIEKDITQLNSNRVFFPSSSILTKTGT